MGLLNGIAAAISATKREWQPDYIIRDEFITDDAAPVASPRTMEPDGDTLTLVQTDGQMSISDGKLVVPAQATPAYGDLSAYCATPITRATGMALTALVKHIAFDNGFFIGFKSAASGAYGGNAMVYRDAYGIQIMTAAGGWRRGITDAPLVNLVNENIYTIVQRAAGLLFIINDMLVHVDHTESSVTGYLGFANYTQQFRLDFARVAQLPAPYDTPTSLALYSTSSPTNGITVEGSEDGYISFVWTPASGEVLNIRFRWEDDNNCMIMRCTQASNIIQLFRRWAGVETQISSNLSATFNVGTAYPLYLRYFKDRFYGGVDSTGVGSGFSVCGFQLHTKGVKVDGFTSASRLQVYPFYITGAARTILTSFNNPYRPDSRTRKTVNVPNGATAAEIASLIATMNGGDILSFAAGGTYNIAAGATAIQNFPNGHFITWTEIRGNGATIVGGAEGIISNWGRFWAMYQLNFLNQTVHSHNLIGCRDFIHEDCTFRSTGSAGYFDSTHFDKCVNFLVRRSKAGPSTGSSSCDGFEMYGECRNGLLEDCEAEGVVHGFEVWSPGSPGWTNKDITLRRCYAHGCQVGFSAEGGVQALAQENVVCESCVAENNSVADYQGVDGSTIYRRSSPGTTIGNVIDI
jgi:hypothetical protein